MKNVLGAAGAIGFRQIKEEGRNEEYGQNVPHSVETEPLASLVSDDVADLLRNRRLRIGQCARSPRKNFGLGKFHHRESR